MKNITLEQVHIDLGAKMVPFAGFNMPVQYAGVTAEHIAVRNKVGVFDVSHMGEFAVVGEKAEAFLQYVTSNDVTKLNSGDVQYSYFPNETGGIVDDLLVYKFSEGKYMLVVNAGNIDKDWDWLQKQNKNFGAELINKSDNYSLFAVQGPDAIKSLQKLTAVDLTSIVYYKFKLDEFAGCQNIIISATGYTGAGGFEIYVPNENAKKVWNAIFEAGAEFEIQPIGLAARDTLRLEKGYCLYGNDINETTSPLEAGLGWVTKFNNPFVNSVALNQQKEDGLKHKLVGFQLLERGIPRKDYPICDANGNKIGIVTSGTMSPSLKEAIGMAYVSINFSKPFSEIFVEIRGKLVKAQVVKLPFYPK